MDMVLLIITTLSVAVAAAASVLAWRVRRRERLRSEARVAALAAEIPADAGEQLPAARFEPTIDAPTVETPVAGRDGLFAAEPRQHSGFRLGAVAAIGAAVVAGAVTVLLLTGGSRERSSPEAASASRAAAPVPLELVSLQHERESDTLTVKGAVRGSAATSEPGLTAVVLLFNRDGGFIASGRGAVDALGAGDRPFEVRFEKAGEVARYRVSFRNDQAIVPHVDKRVELGG
jgi:hypothetical protein